VEQASTRIQQRKRFALTRYYSLTSLLCTALIAILLGWSYQFYALRDLKNLAEGRNIALTNAFSNALWPKFSNLVDENLGVTADALRSKAKEARLYDLVANHMKGTDVVKVKVYALNGITVFSSDPVQTGEIKSNNPGFLAARGGTAASVLTHRDTMDSFEGSVTDLDIISSYLPVYDEQRKVVGVIEIYSDVTVFVSRLEKTRLSVIGIVFGLLALLYGLLFLLVAHAQKIIDQQAGQLENSLRDVELANRELDHRVQERTQSLHESNVNLLKEIEVRRSAEKQLELAAEVFDNAAEGITITDADERILAVNNAFTRVTGYSADEVIGKTSRILSSGRQDQAFYEAMWAALKIDAYWQGEIWNRRKSGEIFPEWLSVTAVLDERNEVTHYVAVFSDLTQRKAAEKRIDHLAFYDQLTGLPNRALLLDRITQALASSSRHRHRGALLVVGLDSFKTVNDTLGHDSGDTLLQQAAQRLATCLREGDSLARLGGDQFVVTLENLAEDVQEAAGQAQNVGEKILATLNHTYQLGNYACLSTASIGIALFADQHEIVGDLLQRADFAMYQAKAAGRNTLRFFDPAMQAAVTARAALETELRRAIEVGQFLLYYQPQVDSLGTVIGAEALLRWQHPERGLVFPGDFISLAEETGLILPVGQWVLSTACDQLAAWSGYPELAHLSLAVNVSARQFRSTDFVEQVLEELDRSGADPHHLKLELTESLLVHDVEDIIVKMKELKAKGVCFSLDDFGTGYSSLSYLKRLPLDQLKIDQGFIRDILVSADDAAIARMVIVLAESLGLAVIAEGVETDAQRDFLLGQGCRSYQGYLFGRPTPAEDFESFVRQKTVVATSNAEITEAQTSGHKSLL